MVKKGKNKSSSTEFFFVTGKVALKRSSGVNTEMLKINKYSLEI